MIKSIRGLRLSMALLGIVLAAPAMASLIPAAPPARLSLKDASKAVASATHNGMKAVSVFAGPDGLTGVVASGANGYRSILWVTPHGKAVFVQGALMGANGKNDTQEAMYATGILQPPGKVLRKLLADGAPIHAGTAGPSLTVLFDPNCIFCHLMFKAMQPLIAAGKVQVDYVLVGIIKPDSFGKATSILQAKDPLAALVTDETHFDRKTEEGGYPVDSILHAKYETIVRANATAMQQLGAGGTPTLLFCGKDAASGKIGAVQMQAGMPPDAAKFIAGIATCPNG
jgi:thiol:disulfide interchange protein DsbG